MSSDNSNDVEKYLCTSCGAEVKEDDKVCPFCGADLSEVVEVDQGQGIEPDPAENESPNPDEPVILKTFPFEDEARILIINLEANKIRATIGLKSWSDTTGITTVLVRRADIERANAVVELIANRPKPMQLGDIFSNSFTIAAKTLKKNIFLAMMLIPAALFLAYLLKDFIEDIPVSKAGNHGDKITVTVEHASEKVFAENFFETGFIDSNLNAVIRLDKQDVDIVSVGDTVWVNIDRYGHNDYSGSVTEIIQDTATVLNSNDNPVIFKAVIKLFTPDKDIKAGGWCEGRFNISTPDPVVLIPLRALDIAAIEGSRNQDASWDDDTSGTEKSFVFTVQDGKANLKEVKTGEYRFDQVEIVSGLDAGEVIITEYYSVDEDLHNGSNVFIDQKAGDFKPAKFTGNFIMLFLAGLVLAVLYLAFYIGVTKSALNKMQEQEFSLKELFRYAFSSVLWRCIRLFMFIALIGGGIFILATILIGIGASTAPALSALFVILFFPLFFLAAIYMIRWYFAFVYIIDTEGKVIEVLRKSSSLVKGYWWRTFGISLLISLVIGFLVSLITTPLNLIFMWDYISKSFQDVQVNSQKVSYDLLKSFSWGFVLTAIFANILEALIMPAFNVSMYYDLKMRKNEFVVKIKEDVQTAEDSPVGE